MSNQSNTKQYTKEEMLSITQGVVAYLDNWKLSSEQILMILGLTDSVKKRQLQAFRMGDKAFPLSDDLLARIDHIVGISDALRTTFPFSDKMRLLWLRKPHRRFQKNTPLSVIMADNGVNGLLRVRREVDCSYGYTISEAMREQGAS
jgi:uncharacterized protein (DUF2384 family)